jgi:hypothetical protein
MYTVDFRRELRGIKPISVKQFDKHNVGIINYEADTNDKGRVPDKTVTFLPHQGIYVTHSKQYSNRRIAYNKIRAEPVDMIDQKRFGYPEG